MRRIDAEGIPHQLRLFDVLRPCIHAQNISRSRLVGFQRPETFIATHIQNTQPFQASTFHQHHDRPDKVPQFNFFSSIFFVGRVNHNAVPQRKRVMPVWKRIYLFEQLCFFHALSHVVAKVGKARGRNALTCGLAAILCETLFHRGPRLSRFSA